MTSVFGKIPDRLYVYGVNWIGDAVLSLPTLQAIRRQFPETFISVLASTQTVDVYGLSPVVDEVFPVLSRSGKAFSKENAVSLCFPLSFRSAWILWKGGWPNRIGYAFEGRSLLLSRALDYAGWKMKGQHQSTYYRELAESVYGPLAESDPVLSAPPEEREKARKFLRDQHLEGRFLVAVNPGAYYGAAKMWPSGFYADLVRRILDDDPDIGVVLFSGEKDRWVTRDIAASVSASRVVSIDGALKLPESVALLSLCHYVLSNDSGMMHLGGALGLPGAALFGPTDPVATGPMGGRTRILRHPVRCSPCFLRYCPIDHRCMLFLTPDLIWPTIREDLDNLRRTH
jgi:heptosyltransferase-2